MGVRKVDSRARDLDQRFSGRGLGVGQLDQPQHLGAPELRHLDRAHYAEAIGCSKVRAHADHGRGLDRL